MQKIVLFIESSDKAFFTPFKAANFYMNRFAIDEESNCEIVKIFQLRSRKGMSSATLTKFCLPKSQKRS